MTPQRYLRHRLPHSGPNELPDPNITEPEIPGITDGEPEFYQKLDYTQPFTGTGTEEDPYVFLVSSAKGKVTVMEASNRVAGYSEDGTKVVRERRQLVPAGVS